jgi:phosphate transport system substrate-binding protein
MFRHRSLMSGCLIASLALSPASVAQTRSIAIDGSSTVFPVIEAIAEDYQAAAKGVRVTAGISGTGGGFKKLCRGEIDIATGSRPILREEIEACKKVGISFYELPIAFDALTVVVNPRNARTCVTVSELKTIWEPAAQGKVRTWKDVDPSKPADPIVLFGAGSDSGTFDYFTEAVVGKAKSSRGDFTASEDDNVLVKGVQGNTGALGYFGFAYYAANTKSMKALAVDAGKGEGCIEPSLENVLKGRYNPLSRPLFVYVAEKSSQRSEVQGLVEFMMTKGPDLITEVGYLPLPRPAYQQSLQRFRNRELGTAFGGVPEIGVSIDTVLQRKPSM